MITRLLSSELKRLDIGIAALSEVRTQDCGEIMVGGYTYYWSGRSDGYHAEGVAVAVSNKLTPMIIEVTPHGYGAAGTCLGGRKSESSGSWCFHCCSMDVILGL